ncbi:SphA family protein [Rhodomicrobium lacus]|uniref:SphA family protein n=1 Tax=Rhodomicrobium lacus TaxID=2498452 RepID=UPI0026E125AE|nr:transporter [Rhodomicrobium lacus]WKW52108.1 transporter [Rhodomicrobium lacus]
MRKLGTALAIAGATMAAGQASAVENWVPYTDGISLGSAVGALPPPGVYFQNVFFYAPIKNHDAKGNYTGDDITGYVNVPAVIFVPDIKILGAQYAFAIVQPFDHIESDPKVGGNVNRSGFFSTIISPVNLSWQLPNDLHVSVGLGIYIPDGTFDSRVPGGALPSSNFWAYEPSVGISWLHNGWNISAKFLVDINEKNEETDYKSGNVFNTDFSINKAIGNWTVGFGGYWRYQFTDDVQFGRKVNGDGNRAEEFGVGPIVGYNFGSFQFDAYYERALYWKNEAAGDRLFTRVTVPLYTPKAERASLK